MTNSTAKTTLIQEELPINTIQPSKWVNIPKCIVDTFQILIDQIKESQSHLAVIRGAVHDTTEGFNNIEQKFKSFTQTAGLSTKDIIEQIESNRDMLQRTMRNISVEVSVTNELAQDNQNRIKKLEDIKIKEIEGAMDVIRTTLGTCETKIGAQKALKDLAENTVLKLETKEASLKQYINTKLKDAIDMPEICGSEQRFSSIKGLLRHLYDFNQKRADAICELLDHKEAYITKSVAELDLPNKLKAVIQGELKQSIMKEVNIKIEMMAEQIRDMNKSFEKRSLTQALSNNESSLGEKAMPVKDLGKSNPSVIADRKHEPENDNSIKVLIERLQQRVHLLEHPELQNETKGLHYNTSNLTEAYYSNSLLNPNQVNSTDGRAVSAGEEKQSFMIDLDDDIIAGRKRSLSDAKKTGRTLDSRREVYSMKKYSKDSRDIDLDSELIREEDESLDTPKDTEQKFLLVEADKMNSQLSNRSKGSKQENKAAAGGKSNIPPKTENASNKTPEVSSPLLVAKAPIKKGKPNVSPLKSRQRQTLFVPNQTAQPRGSKLLSKATDESFTGEQELTLNHPYIKRSSILSTDQQNTSNLSLNPDKTMSGLERPSLFNISKFNLKQMEPNTFEFLSILEQEFNNIHSGFNGTLNLLIQNQYLLEHMKANTTESKARSQMTNMLSGLLNNSPDKEASFSNSPAQNKAVKGAAYKLLKAVTKKKNDDEIRKAMENQQVPQQNNNLSRPPLIQIRPQGVYVNPQTYNQAPANQRQRAGSVLPGLIAPGLYRAFSETEPNRNDVSDGLIQQGKKALETETNEFSGRKRSGTHSSINPENTQRTAVSVSKKD